MNRADEPDLEEISGTELGKGQEEAIPVDETFLDRVSVKDGSRIHIIHLEELLYMQAGGDYVTLFTPGGQYVKEQTMKYFETHLPPALFVRIHRSCICQYRTDFTSGAVRERELPGPFEKRSLFAGK